jgi:hypothetical protein
MSASEILRKTIKGMPVEIMTFSKGNGALVFVADEYAGSAERDESGQSWTAFPLYRLPETETVAGGLWEAVGMIVSAHVAGAFAAVTAR